MGLIHRIETPNIITTTLDTIFNWARSKSQFPLTYGIACCAIEEMTAGTARYDFDRFGIMFRASPRQSDVMLVAGPITKRMEPVILRLYDQMAEPRWVIAMGSCAISGGAFADSYNVLKGVDTILPVDVYVPGCPPRPEALIYGFLKLREKIKGETFVKENAILSDISIPEPQTDQPAKSGPKGLYSQGVLFFGAQKTAAVRNQQGDGVGEK